MFSPHRNGWSSSPQVGGKWKGKAVVAAAEADEALPPPPTATLEGSGAQGAGGNADDWRSFREAGFLDESNLQRREREAHISKISELESELHKYQYNMGILLMEKKEWCSKYEELRQGLATAEEFLKREKAAHLIAVSELEKREGNIKKALGVEKQCVADLEKALREMRAEIAEVKFTSEKKFTDAYVLEASNEEKSIEIEGKLRSADAKLAEATRKSAEISRKLEELQGRELELQRELLSLNTKWKVNEKDLTEQREYLQDWEKKLLEDQKRLVDGQRLLNEREDRESETGRVLKKKEEELAKERRLLEAAQKSLKDKENDISIRLKALVSKEKDAEAVMENIAKKEQDLLALEEDLTTKERVGLQKILDDHNSILNAKKQEIEMEMEHTRELHAKEVKSKLDAVEKEKMAIKQREGHIVKREQTIDSKTEKLKIKEKDLETKSKALKKWESSLKDDEKKLKEERNQLAQDTQELVASKTELERLKAEIEAGSQQITKEKENLKLTKEEREQYLLLQSKLKQEIDEYKALKESLVLESEALRHDREKFEREWEVLDEKRLALEAVEKKVNDERRRFEKTRLLEEERLRNKELEMNDNIKRELEDLKLKQEAFESTVEHERAEAREVLKREHADIVRELELRKHELEMNMQKKQEDVEKKLRDRESEFNREREVQLNHIKSLSDANDSNLRKLKMEQDRFEREKEQLSLYGKKLETDQLEIQKDIDTLRTLNRSLKDQREDFIKERDCFLALAKQCKICKNCGVEISVLQPLGLHPFTDFQDAGNVLLPSLADGFLAERIELKNTGASPSSTGSQHVNSGGRMSWLQKKCSTLFLFSSEKRQEYLADEEQVEKYTPFGARLDRADSEGEEAGYQPALAKQTAKDSFLAQSMQPGSGTMHNEESERLEKAVDEPESSIGITDNSVDIVRMQVDNEVQVTSPENGSRPQPAEPRRRQPSRRVKARTISRTHTMKVCLEDADAFLGKASESGSDRERNADAVDSLNVPDESLGDSVRTTPRQKRSLVDVNGASDRDAEDSEAHSGSVSLGNRRKRRNVAAPGVLTPGEKRYNFRRSTRASSVVASGQTEGHKSGGHRQPPEDEISKGDSYTAREGASEHKSAAAPSSDFSGARIETTNLLQNTNVDSVMEIPEISSRPQNTNVDNVMEIPEISSRPQNTNVDNVMEIQEISSQKLVRFETPVEFAENIEESRETEGVDSAVGDVPSTPYEGRGYVSGSGGGGDDDDDDDDEGSEEDEEHNASLGKKIIRFFTS